jgi:hypothetical protein
MKQRQRPLRLRQNSGTSSVPIEKILIVVLAQRRHCRNVQERNFTIVPCNEHILEYGRTCHSGSPAPVAPQTRRAGLSFRPALSRRTIFAVGSSGDSLPPSPPAEKATARDCSERFDNSPPRGPSGRRVQPLSQPASLQHGGRAHWAHR